MTGLLQPLVALSEHQVSDFFYLFKFALIQSILTSSFKAVESSNYERYKGLRNRAMLMYRLHQKEWANTSKALPKFKELEKAAKAGLYSKNESRMQKLEYALDSARQSKRKKIATH